MKTHWKLLPLAISVLAFFVRLLYAFYGDIDLDEGNFLYDAFLLSEGKVPFRDFFTRSLGLLFLLMIPMKLGLSSLVWGRAVVALAGGATTYLLFLLGARFFNYKAGTVAALLYGLTPFPVYNTSIIKTEPVQALFVTIAILALWHALKSEKRRDYLLVGMAFGVAFLVRRSTASYIMLLPIALLVLTRGSKIAIVKDWMTAVVGFLVVVGPVLGLLTAMTNIQWIDYNFGLGTVSSYAATPPPPFNRLDVLQNAVSFTLYLVVPAAIFVGMALFRGIGRRFSPKISSVVVMIAIGLLMVGLFQFHWAMARPGYGRFNVPQFVSIALMALALVLVVLFGRLFIASNLLSRLSGSHLLLLWWFLPPAVFYLAILPVWFVYYFVEFLPPLSLAAGLLMSSALLRAPRPARSCNRKGTEEEPPWTKAVATMLGAAILVSMAVPGIVYSTSRNPDRGVEMWELQSVSAYLQHNSAPDEEVLTAMPLFAFEAGRLVAMNLSRPLALRLPSTSVGHDLVPTASELLAYLKENPAEHAILDARTRSIFGAHPELRDFLYTSYLTVGLFGSIEVARHIGNYENLAPNPSFEDASGLLPAGWDYATQENGVPSLSSITEDGNRSYSVTVPDGTGSISDLWTGPIPVVPGELVLFTVWYRTEGDVAVRPFLKWVTPIFWEIGRDWASTIQSNEWTVTWVRGIVPEGATDVQIYLRVVSEAGGKGTAWFDNVALYTGPRVEAGQPPTV